MHSRLLIGFGVLAVIAISERIDARIPGALVGLVLASAAVVLFGLESRGVSVLGTVSAAWPGLAVPDISAGHLTGLVSLSLIISIVVMVQTAATTRAFPSDPDEPPDVDRDFIGVGAGSLLSGLIGAFPVNASPPRTAVVCETGGRSQLAGLVAGVIVIVLLAFGASLLGRIPNAALGGVLLFVALRIIRFGQIVTIYRQSLGEFLLIVATSAAIIVLPIEQGVAIGIALSLLHGIWSTTRARVMVFERVPGTSIWWPASPGLPGEREPGIVVAGFQAPLSFLNAYNFRRDILDTLQSAPQPARLLVLEATGIVEIDFTAAQILRDLIRRCQTDGVDFAIARLELVRAQAAIARYGINELLGPDHSFLSVEEAIRALGKKDRAGNAELRPPGGKFDQYQSRRMRPRHQYWMPFYRFQVRDPISPVDGHGHDGAALADDIDAMLFAAGLIQGLVQKYPSAPGNWAIQITQDARQVGILPFETGLKFILQPRWTNDQPSETSDGWAEA